MIDFVSTVSHFRALWVSRDKDEWAWVGTVGRATDGGGGVTGKSPPVMLLPFLPPFQGEAAHIKNTSSRGSLGLERSSGLSFEDV